MPLDPKTDYANIKGKQHPLYSGVLRIAVEEKGLIQLTEEITHLQWMDASPLKTKEGQPLYQAGWFAVAKATAVFRGSDGTERTFVGIGDCGPHNCDRMIAISAPRMAGTRAKGRCLRDALGLEECTADEIHLAPEVDGRAAAEPVGKQNGHALQPASHQSAPAQANLSGVKEKAFPPCADCGGEIVGKNTSTEALIDFSTRHHGKPQCVACYKAQKDLGEAKVPAEAVAA
jgi:hypothetical protein